MRGTHIIAYKCAKQSGIIPADAGNTQSGFIVVTPDEDHPRGCGEHAKMAVICYLYLGSSPRMRGTQRTRQYFKIDLRIIPADAGNTFALPPCLS